MLILEKVQKEIRKDQVHFLLVCLRNYVVLGGVENVLFELSNTAGHGVACF